MNPDKSTHLPHGWKLTVTVSCGGCMRTEYAENASIPRVANALRTEGWRYDVDAHDWKCGSCLERMGR